MLPDTRPIDEIFTNPPRMPNWVANAALVWDHRRLLARIAAIALFVNMSIAFLIPKHYRSVARIMPPEESGSSTAMLAALAGHSLGISGLGSVAGSLLSGRNNGALFVDLLHSGTVTGHLIDRFQLQHVYRKRYRVDAAKYLTRHTDIIADKKSGVITISVDDTDPRRARDLAQAYLEELNELVTRTNTSSAHQERVFIERRLKSVEADLEHAQLAMSEFSSTHTAIDIKEQTRAMVDAGARLQAQLIAGQSEIDSLRQIYGDANVRVRAARARVGALQRELAKMSGTSAPLRADENEASNGESSSGKGGVLYPPLRQLPRLAVPFANLYRRVQVQETVYELLTQQYELARIQEAKDIPVVTVFDSPGIPEKKSFPPRLLLTLLLTLFTVGVAIVFVLSRHHWLHLDADDPRKVLGQQIGAALPATLRLRLSKKRGTK